MALVTQTIRFGAERHAGYLAYPDRAKQPLPAVLVFQEAWGVDDHVEEVTRRFAAAGYAALAPDLYAPRGERAPSLARERLAEAVAFVNEAPAAMRDPAAREAALASRPEPERARLVETLDDVMKHVGRLATHLPIALDAARWLRTEHAVTRGQRVASIGFCMGGGVSALLACEDAALAGAVVFYGSAPPADAVARIACPVLALHGALDQRLVGQLPAFREAMGRAGKQLDVVVYEGAGHAFFNDRRPSYDVRAARDAFVRTLAFLEKALVEPA